MIPSPFQYVAATTLEEAIRTLTEFGDEAKVIAGGQSLLPLVKLRLAAPTVLVDLARVGLSGISVTGDTLVVTAMTAYRDIVRSPLVAQHAPLLAAASGLVGDPQVRNRGTIGGGAVHADPAGDIGCALMALDAVMVAQGPSGRRSIPIDEFFLGYWTSALADNEVLVEVRIPSAPFAPWDYQKFNIRSQDWATVAVAVRGDRVSLASMGDRVVRATATERALGDGASLVDAAALADEGTTPPSDLRASTEYRRNLARVLTSDALRISRSRFSNSGTDPLTS